MVARNHLGTKGADCIGCAIEVVLDLVPPIDVFHFQQRLPTLDGGVGDHNVDLAVVAFDHVGNSAKGCDIADIGLHGRSAATIVADLGNRLC